jgi:hypothetical protein
MLLDMTKKELLVKCGDNCSCLSIDKFDDTDKYFITFYNSYQNCGLWTKLKAIYKILLGRQIHNSEIVLSEEDFNKIKNFNEKG